jgi:hypothetical protein
VTNNSAPSYIHRQQEAAVSDALANVFRLYWAPEAAEPGQRSLRHRMLDPTVDFCANPDFLRVHVYRPELAEHGWDADSGRAAWVSWLASVRRAITVERLCGVGAGRPGAVKRPWRFSYVNRFSMALLYGRAGRLTAENGGFRPGQWCSRARSRARSPAMCARPCRR